MPAVFLSHSSKDKEFVKELYRRLKRDGVDSFFDVESIGWGDNSVRALERAIDGRGNATDDAVQRGGGRTRLVEIDGAALADGK